MDEKGKEERKGKKGRDGEGIGPVQVRTEIDLLVAVPRLGSARVAGLVPRAPVTSLLATVDDALSAECGNCDTELLTDDVVDAVAAAVVMGPTVQAKIHSESRKNTISYQAWIQDSVVQGQDQDQGQIKHDIA